MPSMVTLTTQTFLRERRAPWVRACMENNIVCNTDRRTVDHGISRTRSAESHQRQRATASSASLSHLSGAGEPEQLGSVTPEDLFLYLPGKAERTI